MSTYFVPTRFIWRFGGQVVSHTGSTCADPMNIFLHLQNSLCEGPRMPGSDARGVMCGGEGTTILCPGYNETTYNC